jgi:hypothetical protein
LAWLSTWEVSPAAKLGLKFMICAQPMGVAGEKRKPQTPKWFTAFTVQMTNLSLFGTGHPNPWASRVLHVKQTALSGRMGHCGTDNENMASHGPFSSTFWWRCSIANCQNTG